MIDKALLKYYLELHGVSRLDLIKAEGWSSTTYTRKVVTLESDWTISELRVLMHMGLSWPEIEAVFFVREIVRSDNSEGAQDA